MQDQSKTNKVKRIRPETLEFIILYNQLRGRAFNGNAQLAEVLAKDDHEALLQAVCAGVWWMRRPQAEALAAGVRWLLEDDA